MTTHGGLPWTRICSPPSASTIATPAGSSAILNFPLHSISCLTISSPNEAKEKLTSASTDALISACRIECAALLQASAHIVRALAFQLQRDRTMDAAAIDSCIECAVAEKALAEERARRADWARVQQSAADFAAHGLEG